MSKLFLVQALLVTLVLSGCGEKSKTITAPDGSEVTVDQQSGKVTMKIEGENNTQATVTSGQNVSIPKDFPADVPIYSNASPMAIMSMPDGQNVSLQSTDPVTKVVKFYQDQLPAKGWKIEASLNTAGGSMVTATKNKNQIIVNVLTDKGKTIINLMVTTN